MNALEEEDEERKALGKHEEKQEQESAEPKKLKARRSSRNSLAIVRLFKGSRKNEHHK